MTWRTRTWVVWEVEYAEEGSWEIRARSWQQAKAKYREMTGEPDAELGAALLTPALRKARRENEVASEVWL